MSEKRKRDTSKRIRLALTREQNDALVNFRAAKGHETETAAVRALIKRGLEILQAQEPAAH